MLVHFANSGFIAKPTCGGDAPRDRSDYFHLAAIISSSFVTLTVTRALASAWLMSLKWSSSSSAFPKLE